MKTRVDIKISPKYRDMLKIYCKNNGYKMHRLVELLIEKKCSSPTINKKQLLKSQLEG
ncbi:MAG: hypothetical protein H8E03_01460 [Pelagibacteraceae bacterium]|nr:hypothetical protein [Pelagibacteraceae bacterium]